MTRTHLATQLSMHKGCVCVSLFTDAERTDLRKLQHPTKTSRLHMVIQEEKHNRDVYRIQNETERKEETNEMKHLERRRCPCCF